MYMKKKNVRYYNMYDKMYQFIKVKKIYQI